MSKKEETSAFDRLLSKTPKRVENFVDTSFDIVDEIDLNLNKKGKSRSDLAKMLDKNESEISKIMSGLHNLTIKTISKISTALDEKIITTPSKEKAKYEAEINSLLREIEELKLKVRENNQMKAHVIGSKFCVIEIEGEEEFKTIKTKQEEIGLWGFSRTIPSQPRRFASFEADKKNKKKETLA